MAVLCVAVLVGTFFGTAHGDPPEGGAARPTAKPIPMGEEGRDPCAAYRDLTEVVLNLTHEGPVRAQDEAQIRQRIEQDLTKAGVKIIAPDVARRHALAKGRGIPFLNFHTSTVLHGDVVTRWCVFTLFEPLVPALAPEAATLAPSQMSSSFGFAARRVAQANLESAIRSDSTEFAAAIGRTRRAARPRKKPDGPILASAPLTPAILRAAREGHLLRTLRRASKVHVAVIPLDGLAAKLADPSQVQQEVEQALRALGITVVPAAQAMAEWKKTGIFTPEVSLNLRTLAHPRGIGACEVRLLFHEAVVATRNRRFAFLAPTAFLMRSGCGPTAGLRDQLKLAIRTVVEDFELAYRAANTSFPEDITRRLAGQERVRLFVSLVRGAVGRGLSAEDLAGLWDLIRSRRLRDDQLLSLASHLADRGTLEQARAGVILPRDIAQRLSGVKARERFRRLVHRAVGQGLAVTELPDLWEFVRAEHLDRDRMTEAARMLAEGRSLAAVKEEIWVPGFIASRLTASASSRRRPAKSPVETLTEYMNRAIERGLPKEEVKEVWAHIRSNGMGHGLILEDARKLADGWLLPIVRALRAISVQHARRGVSWQQEIEELRKHDLTGCPPPFKAAFKRYLDAREKAQRDTRLQTVRAFRAAENAMQRIGNQHRRPKKADTGGEAPRRRPSRTRGGRRGR